MALVEYIGEGPECNAPHGLATVHSKEYVRTQPRVLDSMKDALHHRQRPGQVYEDHVLQSDSFEVPRDHKQVKNLSHAVKQVQTPSHNPVKNLADDMLSIINSVQDDEFVQSVIVTQCI